MKTILVTRPQSVAESLAQRLQEMGYQTFVEPLMTLRPLFSPPPPAPPDAPLVMTSRLVFSMLAAQRWQIAPRLSCPCYCIGSRTAAEARAFGFTDVRQGDSEAEHLARMILQNEPEQVSLLHVGGEDISPEFLERLQAAGRSVVHWTVYKAEGAESLTPGLQTALKDGRIDAVLLFSPRTSRLFVQLVKEAKLGPCCENMTAIGLSQAVVSPLQAFAWRRVLAADKATEDGVLDCLSRILPVS